MADETDVMSTQTIYAQFESGQVEALDDLTDIESTALEIKQLEKNIAFFKEYKQKRVESINAEIEKCDAKIDFFKKIIMETLKAKGQKNVKFPGSCSAGTRKVAANYVITDEEEFIRLVQEAETEGENVEGVLETVTQTNIIKREANKLLKAWDSSGKLDEVTSKGPAGVANVIEKIPERISLTLKFEEDEGEDDGNSDPTPAVPRKADATHYDKI